MVDNKHFQSSQKSKFAMSLQYLKKEVDFLHADKHQSFLHFDFNTLGIKVSSNVILSLMMGMIESILQLQYLKNVISFRDHFLPADKQQSFYKLELSFLMKMARHV